MTSRTYRAPWGRDLIMMTTIGLVVIGIPMLVQTLRGRWFVTALLGVIIAILGLNSVRGYELDGGELRVRRLLWRTRWPLDATAHAEVRPYAMRGSWRMWGNGGMFAITGVFSGSALGRYRAFVTDPARTVVVTTRRGIVVVSPDQPAAFTAAVAEHRQGA